MAANVFTHASGKAVLVQKTNTTTNALEAWDFTEKVIQSSPELSFPSATSQLLNMTGTVVEGKLKLILPRKVNIEKVTSSAQLTADAKQTNQDVLLIEFDQDYTKKIEYNTKIDAAAAETAGRIGQDIASLATSVRELIDTNFYTLLASEIVKVHDVLGVDYVDAAGVAHAAAKISTTATSQLITQGAGDTGLVDAICDALIKASKTGKLGQGVYEAHPRFRGIAYNQFKIVIKPDLLKEVSKDSRYIAISYGAGDSVPALNATVGYILGVPLQLDNGLFGQIGGKDVKALIIPSGRISPILYGERIPLSSMIIPDPRFPVAYEMLSMICNFKLVTIPDYFFCTYVVIAA